MRAVDDVVLTRLGTLEFSVHDGDFDARPTDGPPYVVEYDLPYAVYYSSIGDDDEDTRRLSGRISRDSVFWSITYIGRDRNQAKLAGELIRGRLTRWRPVVPGYRCELVTCLESQRVRRDDDATRPDGSPLFYGVDNYAVGVRPR